MTPFDVQHLEIDIIYFNNKYVYNVVEGAQTSSIKT